MRLNGRETLKRLGFAALVALPVTLALLFLMTYLILPSDSDPVMNRMIADLQLLRSAQPPEPKAVPVFKAPPKPKRRALRNERATTIVVAAIDPKPLDVIVVDESPARVFDWREAMDEYLNESNDEHFSRWLLEQGHAGYASIMQGPLPITNSVRAELPPNQENVTGYMNTYGDMEVQVSANCVATTQVAARFDASDFGRRLPMRVSCKSPRTIEMKFERGRD